VHAELTRLVRGGADDTPFGRVPVTTDDDRLALEVGIAEHLDRREELVEVDVEHPVGHSSKFRPLMSLRADSSLAGKI
jgi:hypothetical protein